MMFAFDLPTIAVVTAVVVTASAILFLVETILRRDEGAGRIWALAFLSAVLTTIAYLYWAFTPGAWLPVAIGNATFVLGTGGMWLGARRFNGRTMRWAWILVGIGSLGAFVSVAIAGPDGGPWAGAPWMFVALLVFAAAGASECFRGTMGSIRTAWGLGFVLAFQALYYLARTILFFAIGPDHAFFDRWLGSVATALLTIVLTIVAVVVTSVLRAGRAGLRTLARSDGVFADGIFHADDTLVLLRSVCVAAQSRTELVATVAVRIDDLDQIASAFGDEIASNVVATWRRSVRRHAPTFALVGEDDRSGLLVVTGVTSKDDARQLGIRLHRELFDAYGTANDTVLPVVGVGVSLTSTVGYDAEALVREAREAAREASSTVEASVLVR